MGLVTIYNKIERKLKKMPIWFHLLLLLVTIFFLTHIYNQLQPMKEGFIDQSDKFVVKKGIVEEGDPHKC